MQLLPDIALQRKLEQWSKYFAYLIFTVGVIVLAGWQFHLNLLTTFFTHMVQMNPTTAMCFIMGSVSLLIISNKKDNNTLRFLFYLLTITISVIGLWRFIGIVAGFETVIDNILYREDVFKEGLGKRTSRITITTSLSFFFLGVSLILLGQYKTKRAAPSHYTALVVTLLSLLSLLSYLYQARSFFGFLNYIPMSLHTAFCFFLFSIALLFAKPSEGIMQGITSKLSGSVMARMLIPVAIVIPALFGLIRLWGSREGFYNNEFGVTLYSIVTIVVFAGALWYITGIINRRDMQQILMRQALQDSEDEVKAIFSSAPDAIIVFDTNMRVTRWNPEAEKLLGWRATEIIGTSLNDNIIPAAFKEPISQDIQAFLRTGEGEILEKTVDLWAIKKDKSELDVALRISQLKISNQQYFVGFLRDITERKKLERKLTEYNKELSKEVAEKTAEITEIFTRVDDGFIAMDTSWKCTYINNKAGSILRKSPADVLGKNIWDVFPLAVDNTFYKAFHESLAQQKYLYVSDHSQTAKVWIEAHLYPSENGLSVYFRDVSEKRKAEEALKESEEKYRTLVNEANDAIFIADMNTGQLIVANPGLTKLTQYTQQELINMTVQDLASLTGLTGGPMRIDEIKAGKAVKSERQLQRKDGTIIDIEGSAKLLPNGRMLVFVRDITESKKAKQLIEHNEERYRNMISNLPGFVYRALFDEMFTTDFVSIGVKEITGYDPVDFTGKRSVIYGQLILQEDAAKSWEIVEEALKKKRPFELNYRIKNKDGQIRYLWERGRGIFSKEGDLLHLEGFVSDITQNVLAEETIKQTRETSRLIMNSSLDAIVSMDTEGVITLWNPQAEKIFGWTEEEVLGKLLAETIIPTQYRDQHTKGLSKYLTTGEGPVLNKIMELTALNKKGDEFSIELSIIPVTQGTQHFFCAFLRDITERKKAEQEIIKAKELADKLIDSLPGVFYFYNEHGKFIRWNKHLEEMTGYTSEEIAGMHPVQLFPPEETAYITDRITGVFTKGINDAEANFLTKNGERIPHYFKATLIHYQGEACLVGTGVDITERKKAEDLLKISEQKYKLLFESNPLPMWMLSLPDYNIIEVNNAALVQYGFTRDEFLALDIFNLRPDDDIEKLKQQTNRNFRGIHQGGIWRHRKKNSTVIYVDIVTHDIYYEGKPVRLVLANEVTEQYLAEEKLKESYDSIRGLTEHLNNVREEERLHIAREIHDELGQLLTVLKMDVSWINKKINPIADEPVRDKMTELLGMIDTTVKTVRRIASELRPSLLDDLGLIAAMEWHLEEFDKRSGISTEMDIPETELPLTDALKIGIFRIFQESLTNVARHSHAKKVKVTFEKKDNQLILTIADNGKGFNDSETKKKTLGLLGMKERALMMGGEYSIHSGIGKGTTVTVKVPLEE